MSDDGSQVKHLDLFIVGVILLTAMFIIAFSNRAELRDLQRRVGQLESERR